MNGQDLHLPLTGAADFFAFLGFTVGSGFFSKIASAGAAFAFVSGRSLAAATGGAVDFLGSAVGTDGSKSKDKTMKK